MTKPSASHLFSPPGNFLAFGFGSGLAPFAPGTFGSLAALPIVAAVAQFSTVWVLGITTFVCLIGIKLCGDAASSLNTHDHPAIVWDEIAGMLIAYLFIPITWSTLLVGFLLFRFFDIVKPWPIRWVDRHVHGGLGIMLDDIIAGLMTCLIMNAAIYANWLS